MHVQHSVSHLHQTHKKKLPPYLWRHILLSKPLTEYEVPVPTKVLLSYAFISHPLSDEIKVVNYDDFVKLLVRPSLAQFIMVIT